MVLKLELCSLIISGLPLDSINTNLFSSFLLISEKIVNNGIGLLVSLKKKLSLNYQLQSGSKMTSKVHLVHIALCKPSLPGSAGLSDWFIINRLWQE